MTAGQIRRQKSHGKTGMTKENRYLLWCLAAIELFMSFSFLGYIHIEPISLTFVYIPVLVAGCLLGWREAALLGAVFGLSAMWKASAFYVGAGDAIFSPTMSDRPVQSILMSVGARILFGVVVGLLYELARRWKHPVLGILLVTSVGKTIHSVIVYAFMQLFFPEMGFTVQNAFDGMFRAETLLSVLVVDLIVLLCYRFMQSSYVRNLIRRIHAMDEISGLTVHYNKKLIAVIVALVIGLSLSVAYYFTNRIQSVMDSYGIDLSGSISYDLLHLQIQFLFGMISLAILAAVAIIIFQKNYSYLDYEAQMDELTGLLGRRQFFQIGNRMLKTQDADCGGKTRCFLILDVDHFKEINDTYGHPAGDRVLKKVADNLTQVLHGEAILGRLGGDEFVALVYHPMSDREIREKMQLLKEKNSGIRIQDRTVTCSIGVVPAEEGSSLEELYRGADRLLYEAKKKGRNQSVFGYRFEDRKEQESVL